MKKLANLILFLVILATTMIFSNQVPSIIDVTTMTILFLIYDGIDRIIDILEKG